MTHRLRRGAWGALVATALAVTAAALPPTAHADTSGPLIAYDSSGSIGVANQDGTDPRLLPGTNGAGDFHWSPDGSKIYFEGPGGIYSIGADGSRLRLVAFAGDDYSGASMNGFALDPAGTYVIVRSEANGTCGLNAVPADGSAPDQLAMIVPASTCLRDPVVDPANGQLIGASLDQGIDAALPGGSLQPILPPGDVPAGFVDVSPDGSRLAYITNKQLYVVTLVYTGTGSTKTVTGVTGAPTRLSTDAVSGVARWSPDGSEILVQDGTNGDVATVPAAGGDVTDLPLPVSGYVMYPQLQPSSAPANPAALQPAVPAPKLQPSPVPPPPSIVSRRNGLMLYTTDDSVMIANSDGSHAKAIYGQAGSPVWSPDGTRVYLTTINAPGNRGRLAIMSILPSGADPVVVTDLNVSGEDADGFLAFDATGTYIEYFSARGVVAIARADGSAPATYTSAYTTAPQLPQGGDMLAPGVPALVTDPLTNQPLVAAVAAIEALGPDGEAAEIAGCVASSDGVETGCDGLAISPDGRQIAYGQRTAPGESQIMVATLDYAGSGSSMRVVGITDAPVPVLTSPDGLAVEDWAPDGTTIVYADSNANQQTVWRVPATGGQATELPFSQGDETASYQPVGPDTPSFTPRLGLLGRDSNDTLWSYTLTGNATAPLRARVNDGDGHWGRYSPLVNAGDITGDGNEDVIGRDSKGVLWLIQGTSDPQAPLVVGSPGEADSPVRIGAGWQIYDQIIGVGDVTGDGKPDLVARDATGELWLYQGNSNPTDPFTTRVKIGGGWNTYNQIIGVGDLTGDGKPDLIARDATGELWLYQGTGKATAPFAARVKIGGGWNTYNQIIGAGDLTGDGKPDLIARDTTGSLWLYQGTGTTTAPFATRTQIGHGWQVYNQLF